MLNKLNLYSSLLWLLFLEEEFTSAIVKCNNSLALSSNKLLWEYLKCVIKDKTCLKNIITITNACIELGHLLRLRKLDLVYFIFSFHFYFIFDLFFYFLFLEQLGLGLISHTVTTVTI